MEVLYFGDVVIADRLSLPVLCIHDLLHQHDLPTALYQPKASLYYFTREHMEWKLPRHDKRQTLSKSQSKKMECGLACAWSPNVPTLPRPSQGRSPVHWPRRDSINQDLNVIKVMKYDGLSWTYKLIIQFISVTATFVAPQVYVQALHILELGESSKHINI